MRHLDEQEITDEIPAYSFDRVEKLEKGQMVEDDIVMSPVGMEFHKGEAYTGSDKASYLQLLILKI